MNTSNTCPVCQKPYWPYHTELTYYWHGNVYKVHFTLSNSTVDRYCTGHPLYTFAQLAEETPRTEVPRAFYKAFEEEEV